MILAVVLAAGLGTRMGSGRAKVLHLLAGRPLVTWVCRAVQPLVDGIVVVIGHEREQVRAALAGEPVRFAVQEEQLGTGHALACALPELGRPDVLLVLAGDAPGLRTATLEALLAEHRARSAAATVLTFRAADPTGYGRIVRGERGDVVAIVEQAAASPEQARIDEVNSATYAFDAAVALPLLAQLPRSAAGEIYLTDLIRLLAAAGRTVAAWEATESEARGVNTQAQLADLEAAWTGRHGAR